MNYIVFEVTRLNVKVMATRALLLGRAFVFHKHLLFVLLSSSLFILVCVLLCLLCFLYRFCSKMPFLFSFCWYCCKVTFLCKVSCQVIFHIPFGIIFPAYVDSVIVINTKSAFLIYNLLLFLILLWNVLLTVRLLSSFLSCLVCN